ncbi:MAG: hypothetical protein ACMUHU_02485, partial [Thermoplasmatota archaeon]
QDTQAGLKGVIPTFRQVGVDLQHRRPGMEVLLTFLAPPEVLRRFRDILMQLLRDMQDTGPSEADLNRRGRAVELIEFLGSYIEGDPPSNRPLTMILEDPMGSSAIISQDDVDVKEEDLTSEEISALLESRMKRDLITDL